ncbi:MAG: fibronectin type III domain-containing protein [bacterium]
MTDKPKNFLISAVALASVLILVGVGLAQADVSNKIIWQQDQNLVPDTNWDLYAMTNNESDSTQKTDSANTNEIHPSAAYDGSKVVYAKWDGTEYDIYYKTNGGAETKIIDNGQYPALGPCDQVAFCRNLMIYTCDLSGGNLSGAKGVAAGNNQWPSISPDGTYIIFGTDETNDNLNWEIYSMNFDGTGLTNLTVNAANDIDPAYSFDGAQIVFASNRLGNYDIHTMPAGGSPTPTQVTTNTAVDQYPFYSPDGSKIVFTSYRDDNKGEIYTVPSGGGAVTRLTTNSYHDRYPTWGGTASAPAAPTNLGLSDVTDNSIKLTWTDNSCNEDGFKVKRSTDNVTFSDVLDTPALSGKNNVIDWTDTGVLKCTHYYYYVQAWNGQGTANSSTVDTSTLDTVPAAPTGLTGTTSCWTCSDTTISLSWTDNAPTGGCNDEDSFSIWAAISGNPLTIMDTAPQHVGTGAVTDQCFEGLTLDTWYDIRVSADNQYGFSDLSDTITIPTKPAPPSGFMANAPAADSNGWRQIDLSWSDVSTINDGYYIQRYIVQGTAANDPVETCPCSTCDTATHYVPDGSAIKLVGTAVDSYPDSIGLLPKTCYYYQIRAYVEYYNGSDTTEATCHWEDSNCTNTTDTNPLPPSGLSLSEVDTDSIKISWTDNSGTYYYQQEDSFTVYRTVNNTGAIEVAAQAGSGSTVSTTDTGLTPGTQYCYTVSAWNSISEDTATATVCATTCETDPNKPTGLSKNVISSSQIDLSWTDNADNADTDEIWASQDGGAWAKLGDTTSLVAALPATNTYSATGLVGGSNYCFKITAVADNTGGCSPTQLTSDSDSACASTNVSNIWVDGPSNNGASECGHDTDGIQVPSQFSTRVKLDYVKDLNTIQFDVTYDNSVVETVSVSLGSKFSGASMVYNDVPGTVSVNIHIPGGPPLPKVDCPTGCDVITLVLKTVAGLAPDTWTLLDVINTQMSDNTAHPITVVSECGDTLYVPVGAGPLLGDANCDGDTDVTDVTYMEYALVGDPAYPVCNVFNLDTTGNGEFNENDITCLQRLLIGLDCSGLLAPTQFPEAATGTVREVAFMVEGIADLDVAYLDVSYGKGIQITGITAGDLTKGATPIFNLEDGRVRMILNMAGVSGVSGSGSIFKVSFVGEGEFSIDQVALGSAEADLISADVTALIAGEVIKAIPTRTKLYQNFPNPLNPETLIPFDLATEAQVTINIYNLSGQLIRTLDLGKREAGSYVDKDKAAFWNGRDNAGAEVSSGVYLYQIKAGDFTSTRKMIVLK